MATITHIGEIHGAGSPLYLGGAWFVDVVDNYAYIACYGDGALTIFDISDPANPSHVGEIHGEGAPNYLGDATWVKVIGNYAYVISDPPYKTGAVVVFDISNPANPFLADVIYADHSGAPLYLFGPSGAAIAGNYWYVTSYHDNALTIFDISDPEDIAHEGHIGDIFGGVGPPYYLEGAAGVDVVGDYAYVVSGRDRALTIFDISTPATPAHVGEIHGTEAGAPYYMDDAYCVDVVGDYAYVTAYCDAALTIFDISDPANPSHVGEIHGTGAPNYLQGAQYLHVVGDYAYVTAYEDKALVIFDISDPTNPKIIGEIHGGGPPYYLAWASGVEAVGGYVYVVTWDNALTIFESGIISVGDKVLLCPIGTRQGNTVALKPTKAAITDKSLIVPLNNQAALKLDFRICKSKQGDKVICVPISGAKRNILGLR